MPRITKVTTRLGDKGQTYLANREKVSKASRRIKAFGDIDELNSCIGVCRSICNNEEVNSILRTLQEHLFLFGAELAHPNPPEDYPKIENYHLKYIEDMCERFNQQLSPLKEFVLPTGTNFSALLHLARTVSRRAERSITHLNEKEHLRPVILKYINRVSDLLFILARYVNKLEGKPEEEINFKTIYRGEK
ncbi:MAG: cob(I)yrinic acid a,c-diamide adenosyltransferase [Planctomycetota bacterium]